MNFSYTDILKKILLIFFIFTGLYFAKDFLIPLTLGAIMAMIFLPICKWLEKKGLSKIISPLICIGLILVLISAIAYMLAWQIAELSKDASLIESRIIEMLLKIREYIFTHAGISKIEQNRFLNDQKFLFPNFLMTLLGSVTSILSGFILVLVYIVLLLYYRIHLFQFFLKLSPPHQRENVKDLLLSAAHISQQYLFGLAKMIMLLWVMYSIGFAIAGVKNPIFFAIICGLLEIVPFIGNLTGTSITVMVSLAQGAGIGVAISIIITYASIQFIQGWMLEPFILGPQVKINPLFTILALVIGEIVWGIPGIILAIPITGMLKIICDHVDALKPYGFLIGEIKNTRKQKKFFGKIKNWMGHKNH